MRETEWLAQNIRVVINILTYTISDKMTGKIINIILVNYTTRSIINVDFKNCEQ